MKRFIVFVSLLSGCFCFAQEVTLFQGKDATKLQALPYVKPPYVHLFQFLGALGATPVQAEGIITVEINRRKLEMEPGAGIARFNKNVHSFPIRTKNNTYYVRVDVLCEVFSGLLGRRMIYEPTTQSLHLPLGRDLMVTVRSRRVGDHYRLILIYSDAISRPSLKVDGRNMVVKINEKNLDLDLTDFQPNEAIEKLQTFEGLPDGSTELVFVISDSTKKWEREPFNPENPRSVIKLSGDYAEPGADMAALLNGGERKVRRIVIDPGHGGRDKGAVGPSGLKEKDVTLDLAIRLEQALGDDYDVRLTRRDDTLLSLKSRTAVANHFKADLFISIHVNAINLPNATGSETYYLSMDADVPDSPHYNEDPAESEDVVPGGDDLSLILWDMAQTKYAEDSFRIARHVQENLNVLSGIRNRGVKQASLKVLKGATMPAVLVEVAFISNSHEEKRLKTEDFRRKIINAVNRAVRLYDEDVQRRGKVKEEGL